MRHIQHSDLHPSFKEAFAQDLPISFTGNAIGHLSFLNTSFDIKEWIWHVEIIDGKKFCIVTDKIISGETN
ncbi:MAG TPA: hypothetical protein VF421_20150 [Niabella sp.]